VPSPLPHPIALRLVPNAALGGRKGEVPVTAKTRAPCGVLRGAKQLFAAEDKLWEFRAAAQLENGRRLDVRYSPTSRKPKTAWFSKEILTLALLRCS